MLRSIREEELEPKESQHDTEFTLGPAMLIGLFCGLVLLCGLCFGLGYTSGRRSAPQLLPTTSQTDAGQTQTAQAGGSLQKPLAKGTIPAASPQAAAVPMTPPPALDGTASGNALTSYAPPSSTPTSTASQAPLVRPALAAPGTTESAGARSAPVPVQPALGQGAGLMVQVAAVSRADDANVLMGALRRHGYAVTLRRELGDNFIHVQIGPFANRSDANAMSQKLLGDGYNAVVIP
jgi:DedD protein